MIILVTSNIVYGSNDLLLIKTSISSDNDIENLKENLKDRIKSRLDNVQNLINQEIKVKSPSLLYEGKISKAQLNLENGQVERTFFGDWYLHAGNGEYIEFNATFAMKDIY